MMLANLETARLNVENKTRANLFNWRGQFTPQFIGYLLETYTVPGQIVLDPFCGSGTVLQEAVLHQLKAIGLEINPAAYAMAKFFSLSGLTKKAREIIITNAQQKIQSIIAQSSNNLSLFCESTNYRESAVNILDLGKRLLDKVENQQTKLLLLLTLFQAESSKNRDLLKIVNQSFQFLAKQLLLLPFTDRVPIVKLSDARNVHLHINQEAHVIITSPPYINVFNYHQNYRALLELIGFDILKVAYSEIGSNRKHRSNRFLTVIQYNLDIELAIKSFAKTLVSNGLLIMVLGRESKVRGVAFANSKMVASLIECNGAFNTPISYERVFVNRYGQSIVEDIIIAQRTGDTNANEYAREIARTFLVKALDNQVGEIRSNIEEALAHINFLQPSPLFNTTDLI